MRVVLVEDNATMQAELARILAAAGFEIVMTSDASAPAIEWLGANPAGWDLLVVDMFLRTGHGFEVLRKSGRSGHQRAAMLSNYTRDPAAQQARAAGADRFFDKTSELAAFAAWCRSLTPAVAPKPRQAIRPSHSIDSVPDKIAKRAAASASTPAISVSRVSTCILEPRFA